MQNIAVKPKRDGIHLYLRHPSGAALRDKPDAQGRWALWPADQFTWRSIRDGDIEQAENPGVPEAVTDPAPVAAVDALRKPS